ncbi:hypothetical protein CLV35_0806 [Motilibacter peucedani]|uniref:Uncharacterized protein n=1 Tax=Motilibacter peucedani TaxID=598650 RepID=A0A420XU65_9ACTN|nr:hypothetical protein [Motilibacter peucedani]RKS80375.1 hypothetical protein CLV35_0806 [Motilibacter peucedani]
MQPSLVVPGSLLAGRYLLVDALDVAPAGGAAPAGAAPAGTDERHWRARDELLRRPVAVHLVGPGPDAAAVLAGARAAARLLGTAFVRVLDVLDAEHLEPGEADDLAGLVVTEWVVGEDLETVLLRDGPLDDARVRSLGIVLGEALTAVSTLGDPALPLPALTPGDVLLTADGARVSLDRHWGAPGGPGSAAQRCAAVTYAALTARWPLAHPNAGPPVALPPPAGEPGRATSPRQVRAHVSHELDELVARCTGLGAEPEPAAGELAGLFRALPVEAPEPAEAEEPGRRRWLAPAAVGTVLAVGFGLLAWQVTRAVQHDPGERVRPGKPVARASATPAPSPSPLAVRAATGFDPLGNGTEGRGELAVDGDPSTGWRTVAYLHRPDLGGLKAGVGLLLDLGGVREVDAVELDFAVPGAAVQVYASSERPTAAPTGTPAAATSSAGATTRLAVQPAVEARYLTVWLTRLPPATDRADAFRAEVDDVRVSGTTP